MMKAQRRKDKTRNSWGRDEVREESSVVLWCIQNPEREMHDEIRGFSNIISEGEGFSLGEKWKMTALNREKILICLNRGS